MFKGNDITITSLETITAFGINSGEYLFTLDELQNASIEQTQDSAEITGKGGRKLASLKRNKGVTISGANGLVSGGMLEMQTGADFEHKTTTVMWVDYLTVEGRTGNQVVTNTKYSAQGTSGAEITALYIRNTDGTLGRKLEQAGVAKDGFFSYAPSTRLINLRAANQSAETINPEVKVGTELVVYYERLINTAYTLTNFSDEFSKKCSLYIDALGEDTCSNTYHIQFYIPRADFNGEFTLEMGDDQTVHNFEAESLTGGCEASGLKGAFWTYTVFGVTK